jgi:hypothetical protein
MRVQLQEAQAGVTLQTYAIAITDTSGRGVTAQEVRGVVMTLAHHPALPSRLRSVAIGPAFSSISATTSRWVAAGGVRGLNRFVASVVLNPDERRQWRIDVENLRGHNLRFEP